MSSAQMAHRCPGAREVGIGVLEGHRLVFNRRGSYRPGGVASVVPTGEGPGGVPGVVWRLDAKAIAALDRVEDPGAYTREVIQVCALGAHGERPLWRCFAYIAIPQADHIRPDRAYAEIILGEALRRGFSESYVSSIRAMM